MNTQIDLQAAVHDANRRTSEPEKPTTTRQDEHQTQAPKSQDGGESNGESKTGAKSEAKDPQGDESVTDKGKARAMA